jgi:hypothetical protein
MDTSKLTNLAMQTMDALPDGEGFELGQVIILTVCIDPDGYPGPYTCLFSDGNRAFQVQMLEVAHDLALGKYDGDAEQFDLDE